MKSSAEGRGATGGGRRRVSAAGIVWITLAFVGAYFALRALPDARCGFLHYEELVNAEGEIEFCATNHAGFLDLTRLDYPVRMGVEAEPGPGAGAGVRREVSLALETAGGVPILPHELAVTHTEKMHVMLIDPSMEDYHHVHPEPEGLSGRYRFGFRPERAGRYRVFAEVVPVRTRSQVIATGAVEVAGSGGVPAFERRTASTAGGLRFELVGVPERVRAGREHRFELRVLGADGLPARLEVIMGAKAHMVAFDAEGRGFAHMHPEDSVGGAVGSDRPAFLFRVPDPGWYRLFAQVKVGGEEVYGGFDLRVE